MEQDVITLDLRTILGLVKKNIVMIIVLTIVAGAGTYFVSAYLIEPQFEASMSLVVNTREEQAITITGDQITSARQLVNTYAVILTNDTLLEEIIWNLNLDDTITTLKRRISTDAVNQTQVLLMTVRDRSKSTAVAILDEIMDRAEELLMSTVKAGSVEIVSPPRAENEPVFPRVYLNTAVGAIAGLFMALVIVFIRKALSNKFLSEEDIAVQLGLPVLGVIPSVHIKERKRGKK